MKGLPRRSLNDHLRLDAPMPAVRGDRDGPTLAVAEHLRPRARHSVAILFTRVAGVFPGNAEVLPLDIAAAALVAGEA